MMRPALLIALGLLTCACNPLRAQEPKAVAKVNNTPITEELFRKTLVDWHGKEVLQDLIQAAVVAQAAQRAKVVVTDAQLDENLKGMRDRMDERARAGQGESFQARLDNLHLTVANIRDHLRTELLLEGMVKDQVKVTPEEVSQHYERNRKLFQEPTRVKLSVISLKSADQAKKVREMILKNEITWADAAGQYNLNPYTMKTGGDLGYVADDGTPLMKIALALQRDGEISDVVALGDFFSIIKREDRRNARTVPFEEAKPLIELQLRRQRLAQLKEELQTGLMKSAHIERLMEFPDAATGTR